MAYGQTGSVNPLDRRPRTGGSSEGYAIHESGLLRLRKRTAQRKGCEPMNPYQRPEELSLVKDLVKLAPQEAHAFLGLKAAAERSDGAIPAKYRELISIAVALTTQCAYCLDAHTKNAAAAGATREEIAEVAFIAAALRAGAAASHGLLALRLFDEAATSQRMPTGEHG